MNRRKNIEKGVKETKIKRDKNKVLHRELANTMFEEAKKELIPLMQNKVNEIAKKMEELVGKDKGLITTQIELIIGNRSLYEIASGTIQKSFTPEELMIGLEMYRQVIAKVNEKVVYPPSIFTFCSFIGITSTTYNNYKSDPDRAEVIQMIEDYISGIQFTSAQIGKIKEITTIFGMKAIHGFYENPAPVIIKNDIKLDIDEIQSQLKALNKGKAIEVEYEE